MENINQDLALKYLVGLPKIETSIKPVFIFLHGFGSNERDLFSLGSVLPDNFTIISARSPYTLEHGSYSFYDIDYSTGTKIINLEQAEKSRNTVNQFIGQVIEKYGIDPEQVYLGGFSQGAIMSLGVSLTNPGKIKGVAAFSSYILEPVKQIAKANDELKKLKIFMSHGVNDIVIPVSASREAKEFLNSQGINPDYHEFYGEHEIPYSIIHQFKKWLSELN